MYEVLYDMRAWYESAYSSTKCNLWYLLTWCLLTDSGSACPVGSRRLAHESFASETDDNGKPIVECLRL